MVIEIDNSIVDYLELKKGMLSCSDKFVVGLNSLLRSFALKQHIVFAELEIIEYLIECTLIDEINKKALLWLIQKYYSIGLFAKGAEVKVVAYKKDTEKNIFLKDNTYFVQIEMFINVSCTQLLAENDRDADFFIDIANEINSKVLKYDNIAIEYCGRAFNGGNVETVVNEVTRKFNFSLCIADSDKDYKEAKDGETLGKAKVVIKQKRENNVIELLPLMVREKENLFSPLFYMRRLNCSEGILNLLNERIENEELLRFFDIKEGFTAKKIRKATPQWHCLYDEFLCECEKRKLLNCRIEEIGEKDEDFKVLSGLPDKATEKVQSYFFHEDISAKIKKMELIETVPIEAVEKERENIVLSKEIYERLPSYLQKDWFEIGKIIYQWCCRVSDEEMFIYS